MTKLTELFESDIRKTDVFYLNPDDILWTVRGTVLELLKNEYDSEDGPDTNVISIPLKDKDKILTLLLKAHKNGHNARSIKNFITAVRAAGFDYPEFKAIEKSIGK